MSFCGFERTELAVGLTPIERLTRVGRTLGIELSVKRDDLNGFGGGGNKVRKLEFLMPEALSMGADVLITAGGVQSNHARIVVALARKFGMEARLLLRGSATAAVQGNLLLDRLYGAEIEFIDPAVFADELDQRMQAAVATLRAQGRVPFPVALGAKEARASLGYIRAVVEMEGQLDAIHLSRPNYVVAAAGTGSMLAALTVGCAQTWPDTKVIGIQVTAKGSEPLAATVARMANDAVSFAGLSGSWTADDIAMEEGYLGPGYGLPSDGGMEAIRWLAREEGLLLDPIYTAKGMDGLIGIVRAGIIPRGSSVLFIHSGGLPALFPFADALTAPPETGAGAVNAAII